MNEVELNAPSLKMNACFFFFEQIIMVFFFLKMNEAWSNAPGLRDVFMSLNNLDLINFLKIMMKVMIF